jgi:acyl-coenzyme A synthetase/AMP-(fatty) acid ligase
LINNLFDVFLDSDPATFCLIKHSVRFEKSYIEKSISTLEKNLTEIYPDWEGLKVFIDIKDRALYIIVFLTLLKLKSKPVLVPIEVKEEDYKNSEDVFMSDNKNLDFGLFINTEFNVAVGSNFNKNSLVKTSDAAALYLYTSGSTGKPKLIEKSVQNIAVELEELKKIFPINKKTTFYFTPPIYHIYGLLFDLFLPMSCSCAIYVDYLFTPETIAQYVLDNRIEFFVSIPSYYKMFVTLNLVGSFASCKYLTNSSAPLDKETSKVFYKRGLNIVEIYGSTETGGIARRVSPKDENWELFSYVDIVKSRENEDEKARELLILSPSVSVDFDKTVGFNTGDIVEFTGDNKFILLRRNTRFVKISGKRVDLNYVFSKIRDYFHSKGLENVDEQNLYVGCYKEKLFVIFSDEYPDEFHIIKEELKKRLPGYSSPRYFVKKEIPRNSMGKINRVEIEKIAEKLFGGNK